MHDWAGGLTGFLIIRYHIVQEFNKGVYDYIIVSDEGVGKTEQDEEEQNEVDEAEEDREYPMQCSYIEQTTDRFP